jgi:hypothetical protein
VATQEPHQACLESYLDGAVHASVSNRTARSARSPQNLLMPHPPGAASPGRVIGANYRLKRFQPPHQDGVGRDELAVYSALTRDATRCEGKCSSAVSSKGPLRIPSIEHFNALRPIGGVERGFGEARDGKYPVCAGRTTLPSGLRLRVPCKACVNAIFLNNHRLNAVGWVPTESRFAAEAA